MVDLNAARDQQLKQNDKAIITVYYGRGFLVLHFKYNNDEPELEVENKSN